ncbi:MAG: DsrE/DsrF/DrsH-like family protein, partial [Hyphomonadaceae bacterium]|nr:DsrE/DsrF/DrsH-like family protein [Clostridia bacterium]
WQLAVQKQSNEDIFEYDKIAKNDDIKSSACEGDGCEIDVEVNACGLQCPGPIVNLFQAMKSMNYGQTLEISATDPGFSEDVKAWCERTGNKLVSLKFEQKQFKAVIQKHMATEAQHVGTVGNDKTLVVFSGDLDKAIASFIIANCAAAMGRKVTMFFTFWGLNILRKSEYVRAKKDIFGKMFGMMMPRGPKKLKLSNMNMGGMGAMMIRFIMKRNHVDSLEQLIEQAKKNGVCLVACNMSLDVMGLKKEELIDGVTIGGVASMLGCAEQSDATMFI